MRILNLFFSLNKYMCKYFFFFLSLMAFSLTAIGQDQITVKGIVIDKESQDPVPFVHIIDKNKGAGVAGNEDGTFHIKTVPGDTLMFSVVGYSSRTLVVTKQLQEKTLEIKLDPKAMELNSVNVFAYKDLSSLKKAIIDMDVPVEEDEEINLNLPPVSYMPEGSGIVMTGGLSGLLNGIGLNKAYNQQQKLKKLKKEADNRRIIREKYNEQIVQELTNLDEDEVYAFMQFCMLPDNFILEVTEYELAVAVHRCLDDYKDMQ